MPARDNRLERRTFLKKAGATGGTVAIASVAGCAGDEPEDDDVDDDGVDDGTDDDADDGDDGTDDDAQEMGDQLPSYTYYNNPENYNPVRHDVINLIAEQWRDIGFDIEMEVLEWGTLIDLAWFQYDYDFSTWTQYQTPDPALITASRLTPEHADEPGAGNVNQWKNDRVGELVTEQLQAETLDGRVDAMHEIQDHVAEEVPMNPIVYATQLMPYKTDQVSGWEGRVQGFNRIHNYAAVEPGDANEDNFLRGFWTEALENMNPWSHEGLSKHLHLQDALQLRLAQVDDDLQLDPEHGMTQELSRPDDETIVFDIRDDVTWSDGEPVTAEDVHFTLEVTGEQTPPQNSTLASFIDSVELIDDVTVELTLTEPVGAAALTLLGYDPYMKAKHVWEDVDIPHDQLVTEPVCSGPMELDYWDQGQEARLVTRDDHPVDLDIDGIFWRIIPERSTIWELTERGDINYHPFAQPGRELADSDGEMENFEIAEAGGIGWTHLNINTERPGLDEVPVRQALAEAIPKESASEQMWYGYFPPAHAFVTPAFDPLHNPDVTEWGRGADAARDHLEEHGYVITDDGVHYPAN